MEGGRDGGMEGMEGGRDGGMEGMEGGRDGGMEGMEGGRDGGMEGGRAGEMEDPSSSREDHEATLLLYTLCTLYRLRLGLRLGKL